MALPWMLVAVLGFTATAGFSQFPDNFGNPPPLPATGIGLYQGIYNSTIPNYAMLAARDFSGRDQGIASLGYIAGLDGNNDGLWCQSANNGSDIGSWQFPDGSLVPDNLNATPIHTANAPGQVGLLREGGIGMSPYQGMYTCTILDENGVNQTLAVWAAGNAAYDGTDGNPVPNPNVTTVSVIPSAKPRDTNPPEFILSFNVSIAPPTYVTCQVDSAPVDVAVLSREVTAAVYETANGKVASAPVTNVSVTLKTGQAGNYQCTVSVFRTRGNNLTNVTTAAVNIAVTGTPIGLTGMMTGYNTVQLSWTVPASNTPPVAGYEVFYVMSGSASAQSGANTTSTTLTVSVTLPALDVLYDFFVVAYSDVANALPSAHSNIFTIDLTTPTDGTTTQGETHPPSSIPTDGTTTEGETQPPSGTPTDETTTQGETHSPSGIPTDGTTTEGETQPPSGTPTNETTTQGETQPSSGIPMDGTTTEGETQLPSGTHTDRTTTQGETQLPSGIPTDGTTTQGENQPPTGSSNVLAIVGGIVIVLVLVIVIIVVAIVVVMLMRRQSTSKKHEIGKQHQPVHFSNIPEKEEVKLTTVPVIESFPSTMTVEEGQRVELKTSVSGTPSPSYQWYHDGQPIEEDYAHEITEEGSLILVTAEQKHNGTYKLVAENLAGIAEKNLTLIVITDEGEDDSALMVVNGGSTSAPVQLLLDTIPVADFGQYVANQHAENNKGFHRIYSSLAGREGEHPVTIAITPTNKPLNRFANITVYDDNRISLKPIIGQSDCQGDYINASYIDGYSLHHQYIATQGPMNKTLVDFWRLVWQEKTQTIVMVTNLKEGDKVKCQLYWPEMGSQNYGPFRVTLAEQQVFTDYTIRLLQIEFPDSSEHPRRVSQFHFTSWPDHGVPDYATSILTLRRQIKQNHKPKKGPLLIHCSAGIGRTGTFIAIDMALDKIEKEGLVDISNIIIEMRQQRMKMVQTVDQFIFICDAILESITCGDTQIPATDLHSTLTKLRSVDSHVGKTGFQHQFDVLTQVTPNPAEVKHNIASQYPDQNRTLEFAPPDKHRVPLKGSHRDYINATFVNGYKQKKAFIIAQSPMENTCRDYWKMILERGCRVIVMLCHTQENGQETCSQYWPSAGESKVFGEFLVEVQDEVEYPGFVERTLSVAEKESEHLQKVLQFHITNWESSGHCSNLQTIVSVQEEMYKVQRRTGNNPVVVHCSDTVSRSGMFCAIATAIDRCKTEGLVDVFQVIKAQRIQKPGLIPDVAQYKVVFDAIMVFLDSFETYTNFQ